MSIQIRLAEPGDLPRLVEVSWAADGMFADWGLVLPADEPAETIAKAEVVLVAGRPAVGFATVEEVDGVAHLETLGVDPAYGRHGHGRRLLEAVCEHAAAAGSPAVTLTTFRDVPWNAPWYSRCGFVEVPREEWGPGLVAVRRGEAAAGIEVAPRVVMRRTVAG